MDSYRQRTACAARKKRKGSDWENEIEELFREEIKSYGLKFKSIKDAMWNLHSFPGAPDIPGLTPVYSLMRAPLPREMFQIRHPLKLYLQKCPGGYRVKNTSTIKVVENVTQNGFKSYVCSACNYSKVTKAAVQAHIYQYHFKEQPYLCKCGYKTYNQDCYVRHQNYCERQFNCNICSYKTTRKSDMHRHKKTHQS